MTMQICNAGWQEHGGRKDMGREMGGGAWQLAEERWVAAAAQTLLIWPCGPRKCGQQQRAG